MGEVAMAIKHFEAQQFVLEDIQYKTGESNGTEAVRTKWSNQECLLADGSTGSAQTTEVLEKGIWQYG